MKTTHFIKQHPVIVFFLLAFTISWGLIVMIAGPGNIPVNAEKSQDLLPMLYVSMLFGPSVAGLLMIGLTEGRKGFSKLLSQLTKWRAGLKWYLIALFATPLLATVILLFLSCFSQEFRIGFIGSNSIPGLVLNGIIIGIMVGIFEEIGWTGFVIPRMTRRFSILMTGLVAGILWGLWHFILFWEAESFLGMLPLILLLSRLFAWLPPFRILMVWIYDKTGSLLLTILTHASLVFTTTVIVPMTLKGNVLITWIITWGAVLWILVIALLILFPGLRQKQTIQSYSK